VVRGGNQSRTPYMKGMGPFIDRQGVYQQHLGYFAIHVKLHGQWGPRQGMLVHRDWRGLPRRSSWLPGAHVDDVRHGSWRRHCVALALLGC
jgi:hypothetical protein